jgi:hypothetical protein
MNAPLLQNVQLTQARLWALLGKHKVVAGFYNAVLDKNNRRSSSGIDARDALN